MWLDVIETCSAAMYMNRTKCNMGGHMEGLAVMVRHWDARVVSLAVRVTSWDAVWVNDGCHNNMLNNQRNSVACHRK